MKVSKALSELKDDIEKSQDPGLTADVKKTVTNLVEEKEKKVAPVLQTDKWIYRGVVFFLGVGILGCLTFTYLITDTTPNAKVPDLFLAIGSAAVGALAGLLAPRSTSEETNNE